jgi:hypothetical protein
MEVEKITYEQLRALPIGTKIVTYDNDEHCFIKAKIAEHDFMKLSQGKNVKLLYKGGYTLARPNDKTSNQIYIIKGELAWK